MTDIEIAIKIIARAKKSGKLLVESKKWETLDVMSKAIALSMFDSPIKAQKCDTCGNTRKTRLTPNPNMFGTFWECEKCTPYNAYEVARHNRYIRDMGGPLRYK